MAAPWRKSSPEAAAVCAPRSAGPDSFGTPPTARAQRTQATLDVKQLLALCRSATTPQTPRGSGENRGLAAEKLPSAMEHHTDPHHAVPAAEADTGVLLLRNTPWTRFLYADIRQMLDSQTTVSKVRPVPSCPLLHALTCVYGGSWTAGTHCTAGHAQGLAFGLCPAMLANAASALRCHWRGMLQYQHRGLPCTMQMLETGDGPRCLVLTIPRTRGRR